MPYKDRQKNKEWRNKHRSELRSKQAAVRQQHRIFVWGYLSTHPCVDCGEADPIVLEFDHRSRCEKRQTIANLLCKSISLSTLWSEIQKCDIRCANCHRKKTAKQLSYRKLLLIREEKPQRADFPKPQW